MYLYYVVVVLLYGWCSRQFAKFGSVMFYPSLLTPYYFLYTIFLLVLLLLLFSSLLFPLSCWLSVTGAWAGAGAGCVGRGWVQVPVLPTSMCNSGINLK